MSASEPFKRLTGAGKLLKRFWDILPTVTGLKPGVNEMALLFVARFIKTSKKPEFSARQHETDAAQYERGVPKYKRRHPDHEMPAAEYKQSRPEHE